MKRYHEPWIERRLTEWASWVRDKGRWQGWGSGVDRSALADPGRSTQRMPGTYSDPTLAEIMLLMFDQQGRHARLHHHILSLPQLERRVVAARYCGQPRPVQSTREHAMPPAGLTMKDLERGVTPICLMDYVWSGTQAWAQVALTLDVPESTCRGAHSRAQDRLQKQLNVDIVIRCGGFVPDGGRDRETYLDHLAEQIILHAA